MRIDISSTHQDQIIDITRVVEDHISSVESGAVVVAVLHTSCGIVVNENDGLLPGDLQTLLDRLVPWEDDYEHNKGYDQNAAAHLKSALLGSSVTIPIQKGKLVLGTWQKILVCEFDGPRKRQVHLEVLS